MTTLPNIPKSFVTTIRVNLVEIAKIALFLDEHDYQIDRKSRSKLTAIGIHLIAAHLSKYNVETTEEAVMILRKLGYGESLVHGRRDFQPLLKQISKENIFLDTVESEQSPTINQEALRLTKKFFNKDHSPSIANKVLAETVLVPTENEPEPKLEPETPQLKTRTTEDEKKDVSKLKTAMSNFSGAPIAE